MTTRIEIDPNVRVQHNWTYSSLDYVSGDAPVVGATVQVVEPESGLCGSAIVAELDSDRGLVYLEVGWKQFFESAEHLAHLSSTVLGLPAALTSAPRLFDVHFGAVIWEGSSVTSSTETDRRVLIQK